MNAPLLAELQEKFDADGIVVLPEFFTGEELRDVEALLDRFLDEEPDRPWATNPEYAERFETTVKVWSAGDEPACRQIMTHPRLLPVPEISRITDREPESVIARGLGALIDTDEKPILSCGKHRIHGGRIGRPPIDTI